MSVKQSAIHESLAAAEVPQPLERLSENELERKKCIGKVATHVLKYLALNFLNSGFEWLLPVVFSRSTDPLWPDPGASIDGRVEVEIYGKTVRAMSSMIVHKMVASSLVYPKLFTLSPNVRIEKAERARSGMHAYEFTQLDFEVRNATSREIRNFFETVTCGLLGSLKKNLKEELVYLERYGTLKVPERPFKVFDRKALEIEYGRSWENQLLAENDDPIWVTNIPREFYDFEDFEGGRWDNYDLLLPEYGEVLSGSRREWEYGKMVRKMERDHINKEGFALLLRLSKEGRLKPSAGAGVGLERLVAWIVGAKHIGETQLFPKIPGVVYDL
jgi:asparaginyl-tRNA synthetase